MRLSRKLRAVAVAALLMVTASFSAGCGYLKNVRDDLMDCGTLSVGIVPPIVPGSDASRPPGNCWAKQSATTLMR